MRPIFFTVLAAGALAALLFGVQPVEAGCCRVKVRVRVKVHVGKPADVVTKPVETVTNVASEAGKAVLQTQENIIREAERGGTNVVRATSDAATDIRKSVAKAGTDSLREGDRAWVNIVEAKTAIGHYLNSYATDTQDILVDAERRAREGKFADVFWHMAVDPWKDSEDRAFKLARDSKLAHAAGAVAAGAYGGPAGAAAFASWYTYRTTGDAELAIRVGIISGAANAAMAAVAPDTPTVAEASEAARAGTILPPPELSVSDTVRRAVVTGAIGGTAVAAAGGDAQAVRDGFVRGGAMVLVQDGYRAFTKQQNLYVEGAERPGLCSGSVSVAVGPPPPCLPREEWFKRDAAGNIVRKDGIPELDYGKVPPDTNFVGLQGQAGEGWLTAAENGGVMRAVGAIPGMNAMAIFHDQWVASWNMNTLLLKAPTIVPAVVLTYMGTEAPLQQLITNTAERSVNQPASQDTNPRVSEHSYLAFKGNLTRQIFVSRGEHPGDMACVAVYQKSAERADDLAPWYALNDQDYCTVKADEFAAALAENGWQVLVR